MPIKALNNYLRDWVVKARVASKVYKETTRNGGALLKIELVDSYGTSIEGTFFKKSAEKFSTIIQEGKIYLFSDGNIKLANKKYTSVLNDFAITFEEHARIQEAKDDNTITHVAFNFSSIEKI
jgi:replication factor A1